MPNNTALLADIGGTNVSFALSTDGDLFGHRSYKVADFAGLDQAIDHYARDRPGLALTAACFAVACPISGDQVDLTNSAWSFSKNSIQSHLSVDRFLVVNDFKALAAAVPSLDATHIIVVGSGAPAPDPAFPACVLGPGTGLGVALIGAGGGTVVDGEGGHMAFAALTEEETEVCRVLRKRFGRVSYERLLSGSGLENIFDALGVVGGYSEAMIRSEAAVILAAVTEDVPDARAVRALDLFCGVLGAFAGDLALLTNARGGVYLGGGILPRMRPFLQKSDFRARFEDKGRMSRIVQAIPTFGIDCDDAAFRGCRRLLAGQATG